MKKQLSLVSALTLPVIAIVITIMKGCGSSSSTTNSDGSGSVVASSAVSGATQSTEGSVALLEGSPREKQTLMAWLEREVFSTNAWAATCSSIFSAATCSGSVLSVNLGSADSGCTIGATSKTWSGNLIFTWTTGSCVSNPKNSAANAVYTRTTDSTGMVRTQGSTSVAVTTQDSSGYSTQKTGGFTITCGSTDCQTDRSITINGVHYVGSSPEITKWDHTVYTTSPLVITGTGASRVVSSGTIVSEHNLAKMTSTTTIASNLTHSAGCCFPTGGSVTTSYSGGSFDGKSETLTYGSTCGTGTLTPTGSTTSTSITLTHCL